MFGHETTAERAERERYEAAVSDSHQRVVQAMESSPEVRHQRVLAQAAEGDRLRAESDAYTARAEAVGARTDAAASRGEAQRLRAQAAHLDPRDPAHQALRHEADLRDADAAGHDARAARADAREQQAVARMNDAADRVREANRQADRLTAEAPQRRPDAWRMANIGLDESFATVRPEHPGPRLSALSGDRAPEPAWSTRPYGEANGLRHVPRVYQDRLEAALRDRHGGFVRLPDPKGPWLRLINAFALDIDPTRGINCQDSVASLYDTWMHGRPTVAAPRTFDGYAHGSASYPSGGEIGGPGRMEDLTGGRFQALVGDLHGPGPQDLRAKVDAGFAEIHRQLIAGGHGSFAAIITGWTDGNSHAWAAVNYEGVVHFVDPQVARVVVVEPHPEGVRFVDAGSGETLPYPLYDPAGIDKMDALVVDGNAQPIPFADRPAGGWSERPLTDAYLDHQPADVRAAQSAAATHEAALTARAEAQQHAAAADAARQEAAQHAARAQHAQAQAREAARYATAERTQRDAAWAEADRQRASAAQNDAAVRHYTERARYGGPAERQDATWRAGQHHAAAEQARQREAELRSAAQQHETNRARAEEGRRYWEGQSATESQRAGDAAASAALHDQQRQVHDGRATQLEWDHRQHAARAVADHDQQIARYHAETQRWAHEAAARQVGDPLRAYAERMRAHHEAMANSARQARDAYQEAQRLADRAAWHDQRAAGYERDAAAAEAAHGPQAGAAHRAAAANERAAADGARQTLDAWQKHATAWDTDLRRTRAQDPGAPGRDAPAEFRPDDLRPDLRRRYDQMTAEGRAAFEWKFREAQGDQARLSRALDGMQRGAEARGHTLEQSLVTQHHQALANEAARLAPPSLPEDVTRAIETHLAYADQVRSRVESFADRHPDVVGVERWRAGIRAEAKALTNELGGAKEPSVAKAESHGDNLGGIEAEVALAERTHGVVEVAKPIRVKLDDGTVIKTDVDVVADGGARLIWSDAKNYHPFGPDSSDMEHARAQVGRQLRIVASGNFHRDGEPPRLEWHFVRGVDARVADELESIRVDDPVTGEPLRVHVVGERFDPPPDAGSGGGPPHPAGPPHTGEPPRTGEPRPAEHGGHEHAGGGRLVRPRDVLDAHAQGRWAEHAYEMFRSDDADVADIAANLADAPRLDGSTGFSPVEVEQVKRHVFDETHLLDVYDDNGDVVGQVLRRFDADADMAEAWIRLRRGEHLPEDLLLIEHELRESGYLREHPDATYGQAHAYANERANWESQIPRRTGEDLEPWEQPDGDSATIPEGPGDGPGGGVRVRLPGDGPDADHRQAGPPVQSGGRQGGPRQPGGADPGHAPGGHGGGLAGRGSNPGLTGAAHAEHQIDLATHRLVGELGAGADGVGYLATGPDGRLIVTPGEGRPFELRVRAGDTGGDEFRVSTGPDGVREVTIRPDLLDARRGVRSDAVVARAVGHATGEVAAGDRSRRFGLVRRRGRADVLTNEVSSGRHGRLSGGDLATIGEFQTLSRLRENISGPLRTRWVEQDIARFIERHGLREGMPGADRRAELMGRHLSEPERARLDEYRAAWRDTDPARALAREFFSSGRGDRADFRPMGLGFDEFRDVYEVNPDGWERDARLGFTMEIESGRPANGRMVEIVGTDLNRHFRLIVDRDLTAGRRSDDPFLRYRLNSQIRAAVNDRIRVQQERPEAVPRLWARMIERGSSAVSGAAGFETADLLGLPSAAYRQAGAALADLATAGHIGRKTALSAARASHEQALARALQVDRVSSEQVRADLSGTRAEIESLADGLAVPRADLRWTPERGADDPVASDAPVPPRANAALRARIDGHLSGLARDTHGVAEIERTASGLAYRVHVKRGPDAKIRLEVTNTDDRAKVEVERSGHRKYTLKVPPELLAADDGTFTKAVSRALGTVVEQQRETASKVADPVIQSVKSAAVDVVQQAASSPLQELGTPHSGVANALSTAMNKLGENVTARLGGPQKAEHTLDAEAFDKRQRVDSLTPTDQGHAAQVALDDADNLTFVAKFVLHRTEHGVDPNPDDLALPRRTGEAMATAHVAMTDLNTARGGGVELIASDGDPGQGHAQASKLEYRIDIGRHNHVRLDITARADTDGQPGIAVRRVRGWGHFEVRVFGEPEPDAVHKLIDRIARDIIDRRGEGIPSLGENLRGKAPAAVASGSAFLMLYHETGQWPGLVIGGLGAAGTMVKAVMDHFHDMHLTDKSLEQKFVNLDAARVHTGDLRAAYARAGEVVERMEARARDELGQRLTGLEQDRTRPDLSPEQAADLDRRIDETRAALASLPVPDSEVLGRLQADLPGLDLPHQGEIELIDPERHVYVATFDRPGVRSALQLETRPRQSLAFDVMTGETGGEPVAFRRINADTALTAIVDPHASPEQIRQEFRSALGHLAREDLKLPHGTTGFAGRAVSLEKDVLGAGTQVGAGALADVHKFVGSLATNLTMPSGTVISGAVRVVSEQGLANIRAHREFTRDLHVALRSGDTNPHQVGVLNERAAYLAARLRAAAALLDG